MFDKTVCIMEKDERFDSFNHDKLAPLLLQYKPLLEIRFCLWQNLISSNLFAVFPCLRGEFPRILPIDSAEDPNIAETITPAVQAIIVMDMAMAIVRSISRLPPLAA
ncbi:MAG: hypothetical protein ABIH24_00190 [Verrucomicrobiota bacterium]